MEPHGEVNRECALSDTTFRVRHSDEHSGHYERSEVGLQAFFQVCLLANLFTSKHKNELTNDKAGKN
jgi:hypothetical protein